MTDAPQETHKRIQNFTGASWGILILAIFSVIAVGPIAMGKPGTTAREGVPLTWLLPHLLIVASMSTGFRVLGDVVALTVGIPSFCIFALLGVLAGLGGTGMQGADQGMLTFAFLQALMVFLALVDLFNSRKHDYQPIEHVDRLLGLGVPLAVYVIAWGVITYVVKQDEQRVAGKARNEQVNEQIQAAAWLNRSALRDVLTLAQCVERFRGDSIAGPAPKSLRALSKWSTDMDLEQDNCAYRMYRKRHLGELNEPGEHPPLDTLPHPNDEDLHHVVYYEPPANLRGDPFQRARFTLGIEAVWDSLSPPNAVGQPGTRSYLLDPEGNIHVTAELRRATRSDSIVPVCAPGDRDHYTSGQPECRPAFESRQRWGIVTNLPSFSIFVHPDRREVFLPDSAWAGLSFRQVSALDSIRFVSIDWGDGRKQTVINLALSKSINPYFDLPVHHAYADSGDKVIRALLVTRAGVEYRAEDTVHVSQRDKTTGTR
jgi:hypothetical protein